MFRILRSFQQSIGFINNNQLVCSISNSSQKRAVPLNTTTNNELIKNENAEKEIDDDTPIEMKNPFEKERKVCILCKLGITPDYKNVRLLSQFQSPYTGRIYGRHITGLCKRKQKEVENAICHAQRAGMMGSYTKNVEFVNDPPLFNPEKPIRPHKY